MRKKKIKTTQRLSKETECRENQKYHHTIGQNSIANENFSFWILATGI